MQSTVRLRQIVESRTSVNQILIDNKVKDCLVDTSLNSAEETLSLAFLLTIGRVALLHTLGSGNQLDSYSTNA
jgi:hypothetical protein